MSSVSVGVIAGALFALTFAAIRRWRSVNRHGRTPFAIGCLLIAISVLAGAWRLPLKEAPRRQPPGVGIVPPVLGPSGKSFAVALGAVVHGCDNPVDVTIVINGTAEYWSSNGPHVPARASFAVAIPDPDLRDVVMGTSTLATAVAFPTRAKPVDEGLLRLGTAVRRHGFTVLRGQVKDWKDTLASIVVTFHADWLSRRGLGSCFLRLPALTGTQTVFSAQEARGATTRHPPPPSRALDEVREVIPSAQSHRVAVYDPRLETTNGRTIVVVRGGSVLPEASLPAPNATIEGKAAWTCKTRPLSSGQLPGEGNTDVVLSRRGSGAAYSEKRLAAAADTGCSSVATVARSGAATERDVFFLLIGAAFSMGAGMMMEQLMTWLTGDPDVRRARRGSQRRRRRRDS